MTANQRRWECLRAIEALAPSYGYGNVPSVLILGQAEHETARFTSNLCVKHNNCFGMQMPKVRQTTANGSVIAEGGREFATFASIEDSVKDYFLRQRNFNIPNTADVDTYVAATVDSGYAGDPNYAEKWATLALALNDGGLVPPEGDTADATGGGGDTDGKGGIATALMIGAALWALS